VVRAIQRLERRRPEGPAGRVGVAVSGGVTQGGSSIAPPSYLVRESDRLVRVAVVRGWESGFGGASREIGTWMLERLRAGIDADRWLERIDASVDAMRADFAREFSTLCEEGAFADFACVSVEAGALDARWVGGAQVDVAREGTVAHRLGPDTVRQAYLEAGHPPEVVAQLPDVWTRVFAADRADIQRLAASWPTRHGDAVVISMGMPEALGRDVAKAAETAPPDALARKVAGMTSSSLRPRVAIAIRIDGELAL
jgi:hypothetical protein